jgi:hypothetical protein
MNEHVESIIQKLIKQCGDEFTRDARLCEALLKDFPVVGERETWVLVAAVREGVPQKLRQSQVPVSVQIPRLTGQLLQTLPLDQQWAQWGVEVWTLALGLADRAQLEALHPAAPPPGSSGGSHAPPPFSQPPPVTPPPLPAAATASPQGGTSKRLVAAVAIAALLIAVVALWQGATERREAQGPSLDNGSASDNRGGTVDRAAERQAEPERETARQRPPLQLDGDGSQREPADLQQQHQPAAEPERARQIENLARSAVDFVRSYYANLNSRNVEAAVLQWRSAPGHLAAMVRNTQYAVVDRAEPVETGDGYAVISVSVRTKALDGPSEAYAGRVMLERVFGGWAIEKLDLALVDRAAAPATLQIAREEPLRAVDAYYSALNRGDADAVVRMWDNPSIDSTRLRRLVNNTKYAELRGRSLVHNDGRQAVVQLTAETQASGGPRETWQGTISLRWSGSEWLITRMNLERR